MYVLNVLTTSSVILKALGCGQLNSPLLWQQVFTVDLNYRKKVEKLLKRLL